MSLGELKIEKSKINQTLAALMSRLSEAYRILLWDYSKETRLSPIQIQFLLFISNHCKSECKISQIAKNFNLTQATVSDAIKSLETKGLVARKQSTSDGRVYFLSSTAEGESLAHQLEGWQDKIINNLGQFSDQRKESVLLFLMELIESLKMDQVLNVARTCLSCQSFRKDFNPSQFKSYFCTYSGQYLATSDLIIDCPNYQS